MPPTDVDLDQRSIAAVVFDIGGVFLYPDPAPVIALQHALGLQPDETKVAYRRAHHAGVRALADTKEPREGASNFWANYDDAYVAELVGAASHRAAFDPVLRTSWTWPHQANIDAFHRLASTGIPLAIVSNNDGSAEPSMQEYGVCQVGPGPLPEVAIVTDSTLAGVAKPDPAIMGPALEALAVPAGQVLYVGDTVHADVAGALAANMQVVQLDPFNHHSGYDHPRVPDVAALVEILS